VVAGQYTYYEDKQHREYLLQDDDYGTTDICIPPLPNQSSVCTTVLGVATEIYPGIMSHDGK
jgi:hypothetical protein